jgi:hypothetical protein
MDRGISLAAQLESVCERMMKRDEKCPPHIGSRFQNLLRHLGLGPDPDSMVLSNLLQQLLLAPSLNVMVDLVSLLFKRVDGTGRDVLEQEDLDLFRSERLEHSRLTYRVIGERRVDRVRDAGGHEGLDGRGSEVGGRRRAEELNATIEREGGR